MPRMTSTRRSSKRSRSDRRRGGLCRSPRADRGADRAAAVIRRRELLSIDRCARRHWFRYVAGLREPQLKRRGTAEQSNAIRRGLIVHDVLEHYEDDVELGDPDRGGDRPVGS